jgi:hypothetical protein
MTIINYKKEVFNCQYYIYGACATTLDPKH